MNNTAYLRWFASIVITLAGFVPGRTQAALVEFNFTGVVTERTDANNLLRGGFQPGAVFTGNVFYDTAVASSDAYPENPGLAVYGFPPGFGMSVVAGPHRFDSSFGTITVIDAPPSGTSTDVLQYTADVHGYDGVPLAPTFTVRYYGIAFYTRFNEVGVITSDAVPTDIPKLLDFETASFALNCVDPSRNLEFVVLGRITDITPVPEPGTIALCLLSLSALILAGPKRAQKQSLTRRRDRIEAPFL